MTESLKEKLKASKKELFIGAIILLILGVLIFLGLQGLPNLGATKEPDEVLEHGDYEEEIKKIKEESKAVLMLKNFNYMADFIGGQKGTEMLNILRASIIETEKFDGSGENITVTSSGKSIHKYTEFPYDILTFTADLTNDHHYEVFIAKNNAYYGMLVTRIKPEDTQSKLYITFMQNEQSGNYKRDTVIDELTIWAKKKTKNTLTRSTKDSY